MTLTMVLFPDAGGPNNMILGTETDLFVKSINCPQYIVDAR